MNVFRKPKVSHIARMACVAWLLLSGWIGASPVFAQAPAVPPPPPPAAAPAQAAAPAAQRVPGAGLLQGEMQFRLQFVLTDQLSYVTHPFYQITEDPGYTNGKAASAFLFKVGERRTDANASLPEKIVHGLPPFGVEGVMALDWPLLIPRGIGVGFDYSPLSQTDVNAARGVPEVTAIEMDAYLYMAALRFYIFDPNAPGVNYFFGFGLGVLDGAIKVPVQGGDPRYLSFSQSPVGSYRMGLEGRGDSWGFRYELMILNASEVTLNDNPYDYLGNGPNPTVIDFSGSLVRLSVFKQF